MLGFDVSFFVSSVLSIIHFYIFLKENNMSKQYSCSKKDFVEYMKKREYYCLDARPYCKIGRKVIGYAPVFHRNEYLNKFIEGGDIDGWVSELPIGACVYMITTVQEERYSTEKFEKIELDKFFYSIKKTRMAKDFDEYLSI